MAETPSKLDSVINLAKRRGFVYPCGEIYGGTRSAWDYGPLGVELKENIKKDRNVTAMPVSYTHLTLPTKA